MTDLTPTPASARRTRRRPGRRAGECAGPRAAQGRLGETLAAQPDHRVALLILLLSRWAAVAVGGWAVAG